MSVSMSDREAARICSAIGHHPAGISSRPEVNKFRFVCGCGYESTNRQTFALAVGAGIHHMRKEARHAVANGGAIPQQAVG